MDISLLTQTPWRNWPETVQLLAALNAIGAKPRFVGGCVRDSLLGRKVVDVDIATPLPPDAVMQGLQAHKIRVLPTGIAHGTITAIIGKRSFEITTLRRDTACDGRHAAVEFTDDWKQDAKRRDFTINALYADEHGELFDYVGGAQDLQHKQLRFIGDAKARVHEDYLRILRYYRFLAQLGFSDADEHIHALLGEMSQGLAQLSGERIGAEMLKLLAVEKAHVQALDHMFAHGILQRLELPEPVSLQYLLEGEQAGGIAPHALTRTAFMLRQQAKPEESLLAVAKAWRLSNAQQKELLVLVNPPIKVNHALPQAEQKRLLRQLGAPAFCDCVLLAWAEERAACLQLQTPLEACYAAMLHLAGSWEIPVFPVTGQDIVDKGFKPGKEIGEILCKLERLWESSEYRMDKFALLLTLKG